MKYLIFAVLSIFLVPTFRISDIPVRIEDFFFLFIVLSSHDLLKQARISFFLTRLLWLFLIINTLSLFVNILDGYVPVFQDLNTLFALFRNIIILWAGLVVGKSLVMSERKLLILVSIGAFYCSVVSIIQYFNLLGLGEQLYLFYGKEDNMQYGILRAIGVVSNPNYASFFQLIGLISLLCYGWPSKLSIQIYYLATLCLIVLSIFVTYSRTGLIGILFVFIGYSLLRRNFKILAAFSVVTIIVGLISYEAIIDSRFALMVDAGGNFDLTLNGRLDAIWQKRLQELYNSLLIGNGPGKGKVSSTQFENAIYDNSYLYLLITSGIIGTIAYLSFFYYELKYFYEIRLLSQMRSFVFIALLTGISLIFFITTDLARDVLFNSYFYFIVGVFLNFTKSKIHNANIPFNYHPDFELESRN